MEPNLKINFFFMKYISICLTIVCLFFANMSTYSSELKDLLFHCRLANTKRSYAIDMTNQRLFDNQGWVYPALVSESSISAIRKQAWDEKSHMSHKITIDRMNGALRYIVTQVFNNSERAEIFVNEKGKCTPEKIHPRHLLN